MASRKKQSEGIALLSMYNDEEEDDEMEDLEEGGEEEGQREQGENDDYVDPRSAEDASMVDADRMVSGDSGNDDSTPPVVEDGNLSPDKGFGPSTPQQPQVSSKSPPSPRLPQQQSAASLDSLRSRRGIVDYGHDEAAMSPEPEEGEIEGSGRVRVGVHLQSANGDFHDKTPPGTVQVLTSSSQDTQLFDPSQSDTVNNDVHDSEGGDATGALLEEQKDVDPLDKFLPPPPKAKCSEELQRKINKFLDYKKAGKSFNAEVRNRKDYRNPDFLLHAVRYQDIDQIGSCFRKDVFDPHGYDKSDYYEEIEADMRREMDRKEQERKKNQKVDFISGGSQAGIVATAPKINVPIPGVSAMAASALHSLPPSADSVARDSRQNKKSKWDKVDGDRRNALPSIVQDSLSAGAHATLLSAANAGAGYMAFVQQRRREAEEKRSSERKLERRS
ncbi:protein bfr2 [Ziziphus jujuba]|uniref:Protein bfr2 n=1 Tax=Ziziphus jujuba TaxID=326968 RepID=A0ABM3I5W6_ZIZJJ|nr:protein bfr2 [Ziziphus jujuba]